MAIIRGLTLARPWPFAYRHGMRMENRSWRPSRELVGAYFALHAGPFWSAIERDFIAAALDLKVPPEAAHPAGQIFAVVRWDGRIVVPASEADQPSFITPRETLPTEQQKWFMGPSAWIFDEYIELPEPVPSLGGMFLWDMCEETLNEVRKQFKLAKAPGQRPELRSSEEVE